MIERLTIGVWLLKMKNLRLTAQCGFHRRPWTLGKQKKQLMDNPNLAWHQKCKKRSVWSARILVPSLALYKSCRHASLCYHCWGKSIVALCVEVACLNTQRISSTSILGPNRRTELTCAAISKCSMVRIFPTSRWFLKRSAVQVKHISYYYGWGGNQRNAQYGKHLNSCATTQLESVLRNFVSCARAHLWVVHHVEAMLRCAQANMPLEMNLLSNLPAGDHNRSAMDKSVCRLPPRRSTKKLLAKLCWQL